MRFFLSLLLALPAFACSPDPPVSSQELTARVDARVELMSIIFRLSGSPEYNQGRARSPYSDEVDAQFKPFHSHPVVLAAMELKDRRGVSYDAVMSMALHLKDTKGLEEKIPFDAGPERLDKRWQVDEARDFLEKARDFMEASGFNTFFEAHGGLYEAAAARMTEMLNERAYIDWFDTFFGNRPKAKYHVIVGMLNGACNYGSGIRYPDGREEIVPVLGVYQFDDEGIPVFVEDMVTMVVHELCHSYTNEIVDRYRDELAEAGQRIFSRYAHFMRRQAYSNWRTMLYESLVRASVVQFLRDTYGEEVASKEILRQNYHGFKWVGDLSAMLSAYASNRERYPDFDAYMPKVVKFFNAHAEQYKEINDLVPRVVSMTPPNGAQDVNPGLDKIQVVFDRPMLDKSWAVVGDPSERPEGTGNCYYDASRKIFTLPVRLEPNRIYRFWLNRGQYQSFVSEEGIPLRSVEVTFKTRGKG